MLFVLHCLDRKGASELRMATRAAHFGYIQETKRVRLGGPYLDEAGGMIGSMIIFEAADLAEAQAWAANDPYAKAGLFESTALRPWKATANFCGADL